MRNEKKRRLQTLITLGCVALIVSGWILLSRFKRLGYLDSAIGSMRSLVNAENKYSQSHPDLGYACVISALPADELATELVKTGKRNGYLFEIGGCTSPTRESPNAAYQLTARPLITGMPAFCSDQSGILKYAESGSIQECLKRGSAW